MSSTTRLTGRDALARLRDSPCPLPGCDGRLVRREFKGTEAVVCPTCQTPVLRVWGER